LSNQSRNNFFVETLFICFGWRVYDIENAGYGFELAHRQIYSILLEFEVNASVRIKKAFFASCISMGSSTITICKGRGRILFFWPYLLKREGSNQAPVLVGAAMVLDMGMASQQSNSLISLYIYSCQYFLVLMLTSLFLI